MIFRKYIYYLLILLAAFIVRGCGNFSGNYDEIESSVSSESTTTTDNTTTTDTTSKAILHNNLYWQSDYAMGQYSNTYCSNLTYGNRTWRVPIKSELVSLCSNPNSEIDVSRGGDSGVLMTFNPIGSGGRGCLCMGYVGGNCPNSSICSRTYSCESGVGGDYTGWATKCVSDP